MPLSDENNESEKDSEVLEIEVKEETALAVENANNYNTMESMEIVSVSEVATAK